MNCMLSGHRSCMKFVLSDLEASAQEAAGIAPNRSVGEITRKTKQWLRRNVYLVVVLFCISPRTPEIFLFPSLLTACILLLLLVTDSYC